MKRPHTRSGRTHVGSNWRFRNCSSFTFNVDSFAMFKLKKYATSEECCMNVRNVIVKLKIVDPELEEATREIYDELCKHKGKTTKPQ